MSEQAEQALDNGIQGLADFISDTRDESELDDEAASTEPEEDTQDEEAEAEQDEAEEDATDEPAPRTYKVTVHGEDGKDTEEEVSEEELVKGYQRQADYTRKTQELSRRESEATQLLSQKFVEHRDYYIQQANAAKAMVMQMAGFRTQQEMAELANSDPAGWVAEQQRQHAIGQMLGQIDQSIDQARQQQDAEQQQWVNQLRRQSWETLNHEGIDRDKLVKLYEDGGKAYGFNAEELQSILDARQVLVLRDALAYRALQSNAPKVKQQAKDAPRLPQKQTTPRNERKDRALDAKFSNGRAKLNDLAAFLNR